MLSIIECLAIKFQTQSVKNNIIFYSSCFNDIFFVSNCRSKLFLRTNSLPVAFWLPFPPGLDNVVALTDTSWKAKSSNSTWKRSSPKRATNKTLVCLNYIVCYINKNPKKSRHFRGHKNLNQSPNFILNTRQNKLGEFLKCLWPLWNIELQIL